MARTVAGVTSLLVFVVCLCVGIDAGNTFATAVWRALVAMAGTFVIGLIVGAMGQKMMEEKKSDDEKLKNNEAESATTGR